MTIGSFPIASRPIAGSPAAYSLTAEAGAYVVTGVDASLEIGRVVIADAGSYTVTGVDASLEYGREVTAGAGSYAVTGVDAALEHGREVTADAGAYVVTGVDASLEYGRQVTADAGSYAVTGSPVSLIGAGLRLATDTGSYAVSGTDATLDIGVAAQPRRGGDISYRRRFRRRMRLIEAHELQAILDASEQDEPPPPTRKGLRKVKREIVSQIEAGGLLGPVRPAVASFVDRELALAYVPRMDWDALRAAVTRIMREAEEEAARIEQEMEDEDEFLILMAA